MKQATKSKSIMIGGKSYDLDSNQENVFFRGEWLEVLTDQEGELYIHPSGQRTVYLDKESQPDFVKRMCDETMLKMASKESKEPLSITPGQWECSNNTMHGAKAAIWAKCPYTVIIATGDEMRESVLADFKAICKAVNGTYKKGFDPTQMDALYKALEQLYHAVKDVDEVRHWMDGNLVEAHEALKKAKL
jgi:hypothetical protein